MLIGGRIVHLTNECAVDVDTALVETGRHPQLEIPIEGVIRHRAVNGGKHLCVRAIHRPAVGLLLLIASPRGNREIGECGACPLDGMSIHSSALDPALHHPVTDTRERQLHDHVR